MRWPFFLPVKCLVLALLLGMAGCAYVGEKVDLLRKPPYHVHTVKWPGESLSIIAKWYTGSLDNWKALAHANPELDPNRITMGTTIRIPEDMLQTTDSMPQDFVASFGQKRETPAPDQEPVQEEKEKPRLFGPKRYPSE